MVTRWFRSTGRATRARRAFVPLAAAAAVGLAVLAPGGASSAATVTPMEIRVVAPSAAQLARLSSSYDLLEVRRGKDFFVMGDATVLASLQAAGYTARVERRFAPLPSASPTIRPVSSATRARVFVPPASIPRT